MLAVVLALASAGLYGLSDFLSGVQSRARSYLWVGFVAQCVSGTCGLAVALASGTSPTAGAVAWGLVAALGAGLGTLALMKGLAEGAMHVAGPISAVFGAGIPVALGAVLGERPSAFATAGILLALPAVFLVASEPGSSSGAGFGAGVREGVLAGLGFGLYFAALSMPGEGAGVWPVSICQVAAIGVTGAALLAGRPEGSLRDSLPAWSVGATGFAASMCYLLASHAGLLTVVAVVTSLYPAFTVVLAMTLLGERAGRLQLAGLALAAVAVAAIAAG